MNVDCREGRSLMPERSGFDPLMLPESNATGYPEPYRAANQQRWNRRLGNHAGLTSLVGDAGIEPATPPV
jgi:hypothetical protein